MRARDRLARARALFTSSRHAQGLRLLATASKNEAQETARELLNELADRPHLLADKTVADEAVRLCLKFDLRLVLFGFLGMHFAVYAHQC